MSEPFGLMKSWWRSRYSGRSFRSRSGIPLSASVYQPERSLMDVFAGTRIAVLPVTCHCREDEPHEMLSCKSS